MERELAENAALWDLLDTIVLIRDREECARFFRDLCTVAELEAMAERWQIVRKLAEETPYRQISQETGASTATVTRIAHWWKYGEGGYRLMLRRRRKLEGEEAGAAGKGGSE